MIGVALALLAACACFGAATATADSTIRFSSGGDNGTNGGLADTEVGSSRIYSTEVANLGGNAGTINQASVGGGDASPFDVITTTGSPYDGNCAPYPYTLQPNPSLPFKCNLYVRFTPCSAGPVTDTITLVTSNVMHTNQVLTLSATGVGSGSCTNTDPGGGVSTTPPETTAPTPQATKKKKCKKRKRSAAAAKKKSCKKKH